MPTTARERSQRLEPLPLLRRLRTAATLRRPPAENPTTPLGVTGLALLSSFGRDSSPLVAPSPSPAPRRALTSASSSVEDRVRAGDVVHAGWLGVERGCKRGFAWRFCVLDGARLTCLEADAPGARVVAQLEVAAVERLPQLNRALALVGAQGRRLWLHVDHCERNYEQWLRLFAAAAAVRARRRDGSVFLRKPLPTPEGNEPPAGFAGWIPRFQRARLALAISWRWARPQRMYCALQGRALTGFRVNMEGRWADFLGVVSQAAAVGEPPSVELRFANTRALVRLQAATPELTRRWLERLQRAAAMASPA